MDYQLIINSILVGSIKVTGGEFPAYGGVFSPNRQFDKFKEIYENYYSDNPLLEKKGEYEIGNLDFSLIDEYYLWEDVAYMFINVYEKNFCQWRPLIAKKYVKFYRVTEKPYGCFSNFSKHKIQLDGKIWPTSEHYFQAKKFDGLDYEEEIRLKEKPAVAAKMGNSREHPLREDWELVKEKLMYNALKAKFTQHNDCQELLLQTQDAILIEHTKNDSYWADGGNGKGKNRLGILLMQLRDELRQQ